MTTCLFLLRLDVRFLEIKVIDPKNCFINYIGPVVLEETWPTPNVRWPIWVLFFSKKMGPSISVIEAPQVKSSLSLPLIQYGEY